MIAASRKAVGDFFFQQKVDIDLAAKDSHSLDDGTPRCNDDERRVDVVTGRTTTGDVSSWLWS